jgi:hypothetical protein
VVAGEDERGFCEGFETLRKVIMTGRSLVRFARTFLPTLLLAGSIATPVLSAADVPDGWLGLWRLVPREKSGVAQQGMHVLITSDEGRPGVWLYDQDFFRAFQARNVELDESRLRYQSPAMSKEFSVTLTRRGDRVEGEQELRHPQFRAKSELVGFRVIPEETWRPLESVRRLADTDGIVPVAGILVREAPQGSLEEFTRFWDERIQPAVYGLIHDVMYGAQGGETERREFLAKVFALVKDPAFRSSVERVEATHRQVVADLKQSLPDLLYKNSVVLLPTLGGEARRIVTTQQDFAVCLAVDQPEISDSPRLRGWLAREYLTMPLYPAFPPVDDSLVARVIREGFATYWAVEGKLVAAPEECLLKARSEDLTEEALKQLIVEGIRARPAAAKVTEEAVVLVGVAFARQTSATYSRQEILAMDRGRFSELLWNFLQSGS